MGKTAAAQMLGLGLMVDGWEAHACTDPDQVLLDADIDESGDLLGHVLDLFKHKVTGGTHPHDIHELLVLQEGTGEGFDLGYRLE